MSFLRTETKILTEFNVILKEGETPDFFNWKGNRKIHSWRNKKR